jgi:uncharacterized protein
MKLTDGEKLILMMLSEIHNHLKIENGIDPKFVQSAIHSGNTWGITWRYPGIFDGTSPTPPIVHDIVDILDMWQIIESSYTALSPEDKAFLANEAHPFGKEPMFNGFDGNNDSERIGITRFLIEDLERFPSFKDRELNSHYIDSTDSYHRMLKVFVPLRSSLGDRTDRNLT